MPFLLEQERPSDSPYIEKIWRVQSDQRGEFTSIAASHSELVVARTQGKTTVTLRGPETRATTAFAPADSECIGIVFKLGAFMPALLPKELTDRRDADLPVASGNAFWLDSATWEIPTYDNADAFVARLARAGLLAFDPVVGAALQGRPQALSPRTLQYRFVRATGLTHKLIQQILRAQQAQTLLAQGASIADTTYATGYFDQSHLTNALKRFLGQTPAEIAGLRQPA